MYFLGIDGGGTKTKFIVIDEYNKELAEVTTGPSSYDTVSLEVMLETFKEGIELLIAKLGKIEFSAVFAGLGGIVFNENKLEVVKLIKQLSGVSNNTVVQVENDMHNALYSGLLFNEGMALIAGTGMVAYGKDLYSNEAKCGGWGFKEGDLGSGYSLGVYAIRHMIRAYDGRLEKDEFATEVANKLGLVKANDIITILEDIFLNRTLIASLAPIVTINANKGNLAALKIVNDATDELALSVKGVFNQIKLNDKTLVVVGTLGNIDGKFKELLHQKIKQIDNDINIISPKVDPALAAAMMAFNIYN